jgi:hypothetical protein
LGVPRTQAPQASKLSGSLCRDPQHIHTEGKPREKTLAQVHPAGKQTSLTREDSSRHLWVGAGVQLSGGALVCHKQGLPVRPLHPAFSLNTTLGSAAQVKVLRARMEVWT